MAGANRSLRVTHQSTWPRDPGGNSSRKQRGRRRAITELGVGEALVSVLDGKGSPTPVERAWVLPPQSRLAPLTPAERDRVVKGSPLYGKYEKTIDRESAYEKLKAKAGAAPPEEAGKAGPERLPPDSRRSRRARFCWTWGKASPASAGTQIGRQIMRGILGSIFGKK